MHTVLCVTLKYVRVSLYGNSPTQNEERKQLWAGEEGNVPMSDLGSSAHAASPKVQS